MHAARSRDAKGCEAIRLAVVSLLLSYFTIVKSNKIRTFNSGSQIALMLSFFPHKDSVVNILIQTPWR